MVAAAVVVHGDGGDDGCCGDGGGGRGEGGSVTCRDYYQRSHIVFHSFKIEKDRI